MTNLYGHRWRKARARYLKANPLCVMCTVDGRTTAATELDHIERHHGDLTLFWDQENWQGLCYDHHRSTKSKMERSGKVVGCDANGTPIDPKSHWNTA